MNLARMMTDRFFIEDRNGMRSGPFKTKFGSGALMVFQSELDVAQGDRIIRPLAEGGERVYIVESASFNTGSRNIPGHFSIAISEREAAQDAAMSATSATPDGRGSAHGDGIHPQRIAASLQTLAQAIEGSNFPPERKSEAAAILRALLENPVVAALLADAGRTA